MNEMHTYELESDFTLYRVTLSSGLYPLVQVLKTNRQGYRFPQTIKSGSATYRRVLRDLARKAEPASLVAEHLAQSAR